MATFKDEGVVLRTMRLGEADRIITLATPAHGKVRAVAKGVRKPKSKLSGRLEPMTYVSMMCWKGRELDIIQQVEVIDYFRPIREDLDRMPQAFTMLESIEQLAVEGREMEEEFRLLVRALRTLAEAGSAVMLGAFLWKLLATEGVAPVVDRCTTCGQDAPLVAFDPAVGGFLCKSCRSGIPVLGDTVALVRQILGGQLKLALAAPPSRATAEVERLATAAAEYHFDRRLRSAHTSMDSLKAEPVRGTSS
ncbi:MAG TPA: DNA repair protein RecO [Acidimicrobiales bacterium]|nr:DNA repair protein RecO [Acidimicrobiales bacterium]